MWLPYKICKSVDLLHTCLLPYVVLKMMSMLIRSTTTSESRSTYLVKHSMNFTSCSKNPAKVGFALVQLLFVGRGRHLPRGRDGGRNFLRRGNTSDGHFSGRGRTGRLGLDAVHVLALVRRGSGDQVDFAGSAVGGRGGFLGRRVGRLLRPVRLLGRARRGGTRLRQLGHENALVDHVVVISAHEFLVPTIRHFGVHRVIVSAHLCSLRAVGVCVKVLQQLFQQLRHQSLGHNVALTCRARDVQLQRMLLVLVLESLSAQAHFSSHDHRCDEFHVPSRRSDDAFRRAERVQMRNADPERGQKLLRRDHLFFRGPSVALHEEPLATRQVPASSLSGRACRQHARAAQVRVPRQRRSLRRGRRERTSRGELGQRGMMRRDVRVVACLRRGRCTATLRVQEFLRRGREVQVVTSCRRAVRCAGPSQMREVRLRGRAKLGQVRIRGRDSGESGVRVSAGGSSSGEVERIGSEGCVGGMGAGVLVVLTLQFQLLAHLLVLGRGGTGGLGVEAEGGRMSSSGDRSKAEGLEALELLSGEFVGAGRLQTRGSRVSAVHSVSVVVVVLVDVRLEQLQLGLVSTSSSLC
mmetsp:Transcript_2981/g.6846  ORF Transcript_2981/g.6846 Transcript_2981/m.6846 type:complete len:580 (-) Transcript_2981:111-1850(-)